MIGGLGFSLNKKKQIGRHLAKNTANQLKKIVRRKAPAPKFRSTPTLMNLAKLILAAPIAPRLARRLVSLFLLSGAVVLLAPQASARPKVHTVYAGQRLGSIAKRYNVTVEELCRANGISKRDPIHPGQKLFIPGTDDGKSSSKDSSKNKKKDKVQKPQGKTRTHIVAKGHTLSAIAGRYAITVSALCYANAIERNAALEVGQKLIIPHKTDKGGAYARKQHDRGDFDDKSDKNADKKKDSSKRGSSAKRTWAPYIKPAWKKGYIKMRRYGRYWQGYVIGPKGEVLGHASNKINYVLGARKDGPRIDSKLIRLIASVSDTFGGRELRIVSGYRTKSFVAASQHKKGKALDFSIPGIPNEALRDYLRTLDDVGVGYYPNSSFVHVDVRGYNSYWIDYAGPGEAPRKSPRRKRKSSQSESDHDHGHNHDVDEDEGENTAPPADDKASKPKKSKTLPESDATADSDAAQAED